jgi:hypothetical protein
MNTIGNISKNYLFGVYSVLIEVLLETGWCNEIACKFMTNLSLRCAFPAAASNALDGTCIEAY